MSFLTKTDLMLGTLKRSLGEKMTYLHVNGVVTEIIAVWNREYIVEDADTESVVSTRTPNIGVQLKDLPFAPEQDDKVLFNGHEYRVIDVEADGQGAAQIILFKLS